MRKNVRGNVRLEPHSINGLDVSGTFVIQCEPPKVSTFGDEFAHCVIDGAAQPSLRTAYDAIVLEQREECSHENHASK